ncbi:MFS general substrate transporter [Daldinia loculata]|uniref:MFS general substrate transporter n=1 Tax=Daldinia loculata TaxID=103429 RepID=UPI0020C4A9AB|nr:MFS general substrate transporter [Daldinia loculata]KAI1642231.1 MFS general substrate transporter [Daldinia loculata]
MADYSQDIEKRSSAKVDTKEQPSSNSSDIEGSGEVQERTIRGIRWLLICIAIFSANILYGLDSTIVADIQGAVSETYSNVAQLGWLGVGFTLGSAVMILPLGKAYGLFDNKWIFIGCLTNFAAASALCGGAPNMNAMIVGRVWAGAGGAGMYLGTLNICTALSSPKEHGFYVGLIGFVYGLGCILGPIVGGLLADSPATWRWAFYLNLCIFAVMAPIYLFLLPSIPRKPETALSDKVKTLDWLGIILNAGMYCCFTVAFTFGGAIWEWSDGRIIALFVVFGVCGIAFGVSQARAIFTTKVDRLFPCDFLRNPQLVLLFIIMACGGAAVFVAVYYIPLYYLFVYGLTGTGAAVRLLPYVCCYVFSILLCGAAMRKVGYHMVWFTVSGLLMTAGGATMFTVTVDTSNANIAGYTVLVGLGMTTSQAVYAVGNVLVEPSRASDVIQFLNISQGASGLIGLAIASAIFQTKAYDGIQQVLGPGYTKSEIQAAIAGARSEVLTNAPPEIRAQCIDVIVSVIGDVWAMIIAAGALYTICSLFLTRGRHITPKTAS